MTNYQYLIIGAGMTAAVAADGIREEEAHVFIGGTASSASSSQVCNQAVRRGEYNAAMERT
jgi:succinate dehydrogenase/fumarate reductase flavoprotein subunit